jgi:hypothetical protein
MKETGKDRFILTKAYEVAYALFRLAGPMKEKELAEQLRASGTALLAAVAAEDHAGAERSLRIMECLVKFGGDVGTIGNVNVDVMTREIYALDAAIAELKIVAKIDEVNVAEIFSKPEVAAHSAKVSATAVAEPAMASRNSHLSAAPSSSDGPASMETESLPVAEPAIRQSAIDSAIRQKSILERIRQSGNCRLKDIQELLPGTSERTIRYDLQTLLEQGHIERVGIAGPSVFYRAAYVPEIR